MYKYIKERDFGHPPRVLTDNKALPFMIRKLVRMDLSLTVGLDNF